MHLNKTEEKLLNKARNAYRNRVSYFGTRESNAARKLEEKGLVTRKSEAGFTYIRKRNGDYKKEFLAQGYITLVDNS